MIVYPSKIKFSNLGDILINLVLVRELLKHEFLLFEGNLPPSLRDHLSPEEIDRIIVVNNWFTRTLNFPVLHWLGLIPYLGKITHVALVPGHHKASSDPKGVARLLKDLLKSYLLPIFNINIIRLGVTMDVDGKPARLLLKKISAGYKMLGIRDQGNYERLTKLGVPNCKLMGDLAVMYRNYDDELPISFSKSEAVFALSFRGALFGESIDANYFQTLEGYLIDFLDKNLSTNQRIIFCYQVKEDREICNQLYKSMQNRFKCEFLDHILDLDTAVNFYSSCDLVLTNRLHVGLLSITSNTPSLIITDLKQHRKVTHIFQDLQLSDTLLDIHQPATAFPDRIVSLKALKQIREENTTLIAQLFDNGLPSDPDRRLKMVEKV